MDNEKKIQAVESLSAFQERSAIREADRLASLMEEAAMRMRRARSERDFSRLAVEVRPYDPALAARLECFHELHHLLKGMENA